MITIKTLYKSSHQKFLIEFVHLRMLLQLENTDKEDLNKLLNFAKQNQLRLSVIDSKKNEYFLPGKALSDSELSQLIEDSRKSGHIEMKKAHQLIRNRFNAD